MKFLAGIYSHVCQNWDDHQAFLSKIFSVPFKKALLIELRFHQTFWSALNNNLSLCIFIIEGRIQMGSCSVYLLLCICERMQVHWQALVYIFLVLVWLRMEKFKINRSVAERIQSLPSPLLSVLRAERRNNLIYFLRITFLFNLLFFSLVASLTNSLFHRKSCCDSRRNEIWGQERISLITWMKLHTG